MTVFVPTVLSTQTVCNLSLLIVINQLFLKKENHYIGDEREQHLSNELTNNQFILVLVKNLSHVMGINICGISTPGQLDVQPRAKRVEIIL